MNSIDVIVPAYNEEKTIGACLRALTHQTFAGKYSIIVIDNNSTDNTKKIAQTFPGVIVKTEKRKGNVFAVKTGVEKYSTAPIVAQTDADTVVSSNWVSTISELFDQDQSLLAITGPTYYFDGNKYIRFLLNSITSYLPKLMNSSLCGMNMAYTRDAYTRVGGYEVGVNMGADTLLGFKMTQIGKVKYIKKLYVTSTIRRFATPKRLFIEALKQLINYASLYIRKKPIFFMFKDIRT